MQAKKANNNAVIDNLIAHFKKEKMHKTVSQCTKVRLEKNLSGLTNEAHFYQILKVYKDFC